MDLSIFNNWYKTSNATTLGAIRKVEQLIGFGLPEDYTKLLMSFNGGEGFIGESYLILWAIDDLILYNQEYEVHKYAPDVFLFGSDGGGEAYGFDLRKQTMNVVKIPFIGMNIKHAINIANSFSDFLTFLNSEEENND